MLGTDFVMQSPAKCTRQNFPKDSQRVHRRKDYFNKKFRRGPTHPGVAHSSLSTLAISHSISPWSAQSMLIPRPKWSEECTAPDQHSSCSTYYSFVVFVSCLCLFHYPYLLCRDVHIIQSVTPIRLAAIVTYRIK